MSLKIKGFNKVSIDVEDIGNGKPIVFIHGWPVNHNEIFYINPSWNQ
jgi:non-heme chloroperoxidase